MAVNYNTFPMVTSGLTIGLDPGNIKSYPGSGTAWGDISGNGNNSNLRASGSFASNNGGVIRSSGSFAAADVSIPGFTDYTLSFWIYFITLSTSITQRYIFGAPLGATRSGSVSVKLVSSVWYWTYTDSADRTTTITPSTGVWYNIVITRTGSSVQFYINGVLTQTLVAGGGIASGTGFFGDLTAAAGNFVDGYFSAIYFYNKVLSASEISQNFNVLRGRFGL